MYTLYYVYDAKKDFKKIIKSHHRDSCLQLLDLIAHNPFQMPPPYKKLSGVYAGMFHEELIYNIDCSMKLMRKIKE